MTQERPADLTISVEELQTLAPTELETLPWLTSLSGVLMVINPQYGGPRVRVAMEGRLLDLLDPYLSRPGVRDFLLRRLPILQGRTPNARGFLWFEVDVPATPTAPYIWLRIYAPVGVFTQTLKQIQEMSHGKH